jgi:hypothetical protein
MARSAATDSARTYPALADARAGFSAAAIPAAVPDSSAALARVPYPARPCAQRRSTGRAPRAESFGVVRRVVAVIFVAQFVALDVWSRGVTGLLASSAGAAHVTTSVLLWLVLGSLCSVEWRRAPVALLAGTDIVVQAAFYRYYHAPVDVQVVTAAARSWGDIRPVLSYGAAPYALAACVLSACEYGVISFCAGAFDWPRRVRLGMLLALVVAGCLGPGRAAAREFAQVDRVSGPVRVGPRPSVRPSLPSVLFVITESVRASDYCPKRRDGCRVAPEVDTLVPGRIEFREMRSVSSYTAVSVAAILGGVVPVGRRDVATRTPLLFDFARALRHSSESLSVAYWSAQTAATLDRPDLRKTADSFVTIEDLVGQPVGDEDEVFDRGVDRLLAARVGLEIRKIGVPFLSVVHFQGTHAPYFIDESDAPFRPFSHVVAWSGLDELHNAYLDAIHEQDKSIAKVIRAFLAKVGAAPYVILFTSDHGEAFGEHGAIHHGQNLFEEQIHVPAWLAAGNGALGDGELAALRAYEHALTTHLDLLPTLLDIEGILGGDASPGSDAMGRSLIRSFRPLSAPIPITNCTELFRCPLDTWGLLGESRELVAQPWDSDWQCVDLHGAPAGAGDATCRELRTSSQTWFPRKPNGAQNR